ncbi:unnamed protein product [Ceratitis capitata]|uniref:(Mediterranean fruit fly) hypothetical protein n=1 Tax=Ceratitis capitata TaxID=7213 RepID=A0A811USL0_CERCA|nr:unnamed protein product [Ceratitis capitata]
MTTSVEFSFKPRITLKKLGVHCVKMDTSYLIAEPSSHLAFQTDGIKLSSIVCVFLTSHTAPDCRRRKPCRTNGCQRVHNRLLHEASRCGSNSPPVETQPQKAASTGDAVFSCTSNTMKKQKVLFKTVPVTLHSREAHI